MDNKAEETTRKFIIRERLGWLATMSQYIPPVLRKRFTDAIDEIRQLTN